MRVRWMAFLLLLGVTPVLVAADLAGHLARFHRLAGQKDFVRAEAVAREAVRLDPGSRAARKALADVLLWQAKYADAARHYRDLLESDAGDREARLGLANALYWSGDFRAAAREYRRIPSHPEAARALSEIRAASAPGFRAQALLRSDDQPLRTLMTEAGGFVFSDPLTTWEGTVGAYRFDHDSLDTDAPFGRLSAKTTLPRVATTLRGELTLLRFPDDETRALGRLAAEHRIGTSTASLSAARRELFGSALSLATHPYVDSLELRWQKSNASVRGERLRYFDDNSGVAADAWFLVPLGSFSAGAAVAYRDTDESRFIAAGVYDPYWTPIELREARAVAVARSDFGPLSASLHLDAGIAHERQNGRYNPWRGAVSITMPFSGATVNVELGRVSTVFYTANEISASVAGRF